MSPERVGHNRAKGKVYLALTRAMATAGVMGEVFTGGLTVPIDDHTAYEPDALVRCGAPLPPDQMKVTDPVIIVEVKSPSTAHMDTSAKLMAISNCKAFATIFLSMQMRAVSAVIGAPPVRLSKQTH